MSFVADVIYGLKHEYGQEVTVRRDKYNRNYETGEKTLAESLTQTLHRVIFLPLSQRQWFYKAVNLQTELYLKAGEEQIVLDAADLAWEIQVNDFLLDDEGSRYDITRIENISKEALILTVKEIL